MNEIEGQPMEQEFHEANVEIERLLWCSLERCLQAGAKPEDLRFIAAMCGVKDWTPDAHARTRRVGG